MSLCGAISLVQKLKLCDKKNWGIAVNQGNYKSFFGKMQHSLFVVVKKKKETKYKKLIDCFVNVQDNPKVWPHLQITQITQNLKTEILYKPHTYNLYQMKARAY